MELLQTDEHYILNKGQHSLWFDRKTGLHEYKTCWDLASAQNPTCLGTLHTILGKLQVHPDLPPRLAVVTGVREVGAPVCGSTGPGSRIYGIRRVAFIPLSMQPLDASFLAVLGLQPCHKHRAGSSDNHRHVGVLPDPRVGLSRTFGTLRSVTTSLRTATANVAANATGQNKTRKDDRDKERYERRILDELLKMFNESESGESFYYGSDGVDLTSSLQRQSTPDYDRHAPLWLRADDRFFWNRHMMADFMPAEAASPVKDGAAVWVVPVIQGFVQIEAVPLDTPDTNTQAHNAQPGDYYCLCVVSRRSRHRAGTRYRRRGVDDDGHVANYVETEQLVALNTHVIAFVQTERLAVPNATVMAFVQVRGSVPVFWSQPGFKYRPPPRLDKGPDETQAAFARHFEREVQRHGHVTCVSLVEQAGKEKVIADAYTENILRLNSSNLTYVTFDFHEYCRGLRYENVCILLEGLSTVLQSAGYCWVDQQGVICTQSAVCRTNCIDCLDRTNLVQTAIGRSVLERQFVKLGLLSPDQPLPDLCRAALNTMWANNGDTLSRQYAGTQALKGDFTRTGERKFSSLMKDGMNSANRSLNTAVSESLRQAAIDTMLGQQPPAPEQSDVGGGLGKSLLWSTNHALHSLGDASRYYMNRFKDAYRQATIDHMLGNPQSSYLLHLDTDVPDVGAEEEEDANAVAQHVKGVIDDATKLLVPDAHTILGGWGLIDADPQTGDPEQVDMDTILVLTRDSYYVAAYDEATDRITRFQRVSLIDLDAIEVGPYTFPAVFKHSRVHHCLRLCYQVEKQSGYFHMLRPMNISFFNNLAITIRSEEERIESIKAIGDTFEAGVQLMGCEAPLLLLPRLEKRRSRRLAGNRTSPLSPLHLLSTPLTSLSRGSNDAFKSVTSGLARLNPISSLRRGARVEERGVPSTTFYQEKPVVAVEYFPVGVDATGYMYPEIHLPQCGILASSVTTQAHQDLSHIPPLPCSPLSRSLSESCILLSRRGSIPQHQPGLSPPLSPLPTSNRSLTPEIFVSGCLEEQLGEIGSLGSRRPHYLQQLTPLASQRVRKLSHSSDEVDPRDSGGAAASLSLSIIDGTKDLTSTSILRASSATDLQLHLASSASEGLLTRRAVTAAHSNPASPLAAFQRDGVFGAPLSALAKGMQSLAPGAGKLARGMQNIGANLDPKKLRAQREKLAEQDLVWRAKKAACQTVIIEF